MRQPLLPKHIAQQNARAKHITPLKIRVPGALALLSIAVVAAGCGGASRGSGVARLSSTNGTSPTSSRASGSAAQRTLSQEQQLLAFAECMRSNGVPNFPDPGSSGGFRVPAGANPSSPAFKSAQAKCAKLMGGGFGEGPPPSARTVAHYLKVAQCMRAHGISDFPDPRTSMPSTPTPGAGVIADREGVILVIPEAAQQSPVYVKAAAACGFALTNH